MFNEFMATCPIRITKQTQEGTAENISAALKVERSFLEIISMRDFKSITFRLSKWKILNFPTISDVLDWLCSVSM